ncbi:DNA cytosine methyltransferase [Paenibacillus taichungensis]|uniref:DNA (cytosine-5-)-methyltransferase n=1 Tax=Paenibacillus taichungensis TaxID=484184 RepID=A0ABX2MIN8_9BACL|nr:DNA cytosine methyltransferase [Paenibacillus taichungensis]NUU52990.1 DNA cytosine methyltransferase [Paenibacillus taichungensis]
MNLVMKKVYKVTEKALKPRVWIYSLVCESAGFLPGQKLYISTDQNANEIIVQNQPVTEDDHVVHVSSKRTSKGAQRPIVDTAKESYRSIIDVDHKVEMCVYKDNDLSRVIIKPLEFSLFKKESMVRTNDERISTFTICSGAGFVTSAFQDSGYFSSVGAIELDEDSGAVYRHNFPSTFLFSGDLLDCNTVTEADVTVVTLPCNEASPLGNHEEGTFNNLSLAASELIRATKCRAIFFENVNDFYKTSAYQTLKELLSDEFPFWKESHIEAIDFGSIARRSRTYVVAVRTEEDFTNFSFPKPPERIRRKKLKEYLDGKHVAQHWKPLENFMDSFKAKADKNNSWKDRSLSKTFVDPQVTEIQCIPKRYRAQSASSTYLVSEDKQSFRFLTIAEIRKILSVPDWFEYPDYISETRKYEMIGQSVDCRVIKSIANNIAAMFFKGLRALQASSLPGVRNNAVTENSEGQLGYIF